MRRRVTPAIVLFLAGIALAGTGCFESKPAGVTVNGEVTVGTGTTATVVNPATATGAPPPATTAAATTTSAGGGTADVAAGKALFTQKCGGCHTLKDAATTGTVGPDLDQIAPDAATVAHQIANATPPMPKDLVTGQDAQNVAAYVSSVAGKS